MVQGINSLELSIKLKNDRVHLLDVRELHEYALEHIPSAIFFPLSEMEDRYSSLDHTQTYYVICHSGGRSQKACEFLSRKKFNVVNVSDGMNAWKGTVISGIKRKDVSSENQ